MRFIHVGKEQLTLIGADEAEVSTLREDVITALLGGVATGEITAWEATQATSMLMGHDTQEANKIRGDTIKSAALTAIKGSINSNMYRNTLLVRATEQAARGFISPQQYIERNEYLEQSSLSDLNAIANDGQPLDYDEGGILAEKIRPLTDDGHFNLHEIAATVGATHITSTYEISYDETGTPYVATDRSHTQLGSLDNAGDFQPILTILDQDHPVRQPS